MTVAVRNGVVRVGLTGGELRDLAKAGGEGRATKYTTRELGYALTATSPVLGDNTVLWGSTTVASTMHIAAKAGIDLLVTGGTGGVHRDFKNSHDVSADLTALSRTPVTVVSAGVKSILDIPRTLQYLETAGVTVGVFGSDEFPAFFSPSSGVKSPLTFTSISEVAQTIINNRLLNLPSGFLLACPNPSPLAGVDEAVETAVGEVERNGIEGKDVTPFLLKRVAELTEGESLTSNIALVENNARIGTDGEFHSCHQSGRGGEGGWKRTVTTNNRIVTPWVKP